ncbi:hypothetical protein [Kitasatospora sp. NPDC051705]|uniref:hypothetical protein n=1 Tax=Kitasatospora sp. NPDC051705 TaxID=3364057 RepID=UPI003792F4A8
MSHPRTLHALTAAVVVAAVTLGPAHLAAAAAPAASAAAPAVPAVARAVPAQDLPSVDQLRSALLTAADLGPDYTEAPSSESPGPEENPTPVSGCDALSALINMRTGQNGPATPHAEVELDGPDGNPMVTQSLTAEDPAKLTSDFNTVSDALKSCHSITFNAGTEDTVTFTVSPVALGDRQDAPAVRLDGTLAGVQLNAFVGIERFGDVGMAFGFFQRQGADSQLASLQYRTAVAKVERTLGVAAGSTAPATASPTGSVV